MKYKVNKGFIVEKFDDKTVIFDSDDSVLYTFNETASYIFTKLKKGLPEGKIIENIVKKFKIKQERAKNDLYDLLSDLKKKKIVSS